MMDNADNVAVKRFVAAGLATAFGYYVFSNLKNTVDARRPLALSKEPQRLNLVNFSSVEAAALSAVVGSWASALEIVPTACLIYDDVSHVGNPLNAAMSDALGARTQQLGSPNDLFVGQRVGVRIGQPGTNSARGHYELTAAECDRGQLVAHAERLDGAPMEITAYVALVLANGRMRTFQHTSCGHVCKPSHVPLNASSLEDLFVVDTDDLREPFPVLSELLPLRTLKADANVDLAAGASDAAQRHVKENIGEGMTSALLIRPYRWRAHLQLAYELMYADQEKALGPGLGTAMAQGLVDAPHVAWSWVKQATTGRHSSVDRGRTAQQNILRYRSDDPLCGRFENHITINFDDAKTADENSDKLTAIASHLGIKIVSISLPKGAAFPTQVMTSYYTTGHVRMCTQALLEQAMLLTLCGFRCARAKMELQLTEDVRAPFFQRAVSLSADLPPQIVGICPLDDDLAKDRRAMTALQYYEFHVKVAIPESRALDAMPQLRGLAVQHSAHLSKNAFKVYVSTADSAAPGTP
jgi:hypothetical protein